MCVGEIRQFCKLQDEGQSLMRVAMTQLNLSARAYHRILKLSRTIADLAGSQEIQSAHLAEALQYRPKLMMDDTVSDTKFTLYRLPMTLLQFLIQANSPWHWLGIQLITQ